MNAARLDEFAGPGMTTNESKCFGFVHGTTNELGSETGLPDGQQGMSWNLDQFRFQQSRVEIGRVICKLEGPNTRI